MLDLLEWTWTILNTISMCVLIAVVREGILDLIAARAVAPEENGRRGIFAAMYLRVRLFLLVNAILFTVTGVGAILTPNPPAEFIGPRVASAAVANVFALLTLMLVVLDYLDRLRIARYKTRKEEDQ